MQAENGAMQQLKNNVLRRLDSNLVTLMESFNLDIPTALRYAEVTKSSPLGSIGEAGKPYYRSQVDKLERNYRTGNWLDQDFRSNSLPDLRKAIEKWE